MWAVALKAGPHMHVARPQLIIFMPLLTLMTPHHLTLCPGAQPQGEAPLRGRRGCLQAGPAQCAPLHTFILGFSGPLPHPCRCYSTCVGSGLWGIGGGGLCQGRRGGWLGLPVPGQDGGICLSQGRRGVRAPPRGGPGDYFCSAVYPRVAFLLCRWRQGARRHRQGAEADGPRPGAQQGRTARLRKRVLVNHM